MNSHDVTAWKDKGSYKHADTPKSSDKKPDHHSTHRNREEAHKKAEELSKTHTHVFHDWYGVRQASWHKGKQHGHGLYGQPPHRRTSESLLVEIAEFLSEESRERGIRRLISKKSKPMSPDVQKTNARYMANAKRRRSRSEKHSRHAQQKHKKCH